MFRSANSQITPDGQFKAWSGDATGYAALQRGDATHTGSVSFYKWDGATKFATLGADTTAMLTLNLQNSAGFNITGASSVNVDGTAGATCAVTTPAHLSVVKGIVTLCN